MSIRKLEHESIEAFLRESDKLHGQVLDFGAGKQPYRELIEATGAAYTPYDDPRFPASTALEKTPYPVGEFDTVVCTQVIQYASDPLDMLAYIRGFLRHEGWLLMTGPTNWPVVEVDDKWRFTTTGVVTLLHRAGFTDSLVEPRAATHFGGEIWSLGWQATARG